MASYESFPHPNHSDRKPSFVCAHGVLAVLVVYILVAWQVDHDAIGLWQTGSVKGRCDEAPPRTLYNPTQACIAKLLGDGESCSCDSRNNGNNTYDVRQMPSTTHGPPVITNGSTVHITSLGEPRFPARMTLMASIPESCTCSDIYEGVVSGQNVTMPVSISPYPDGIYSIEVTLPGPDAYELKKLWALEKGYLPHPACRNRDVAATGTVCFEDDQTFMERSLFFQAHIVVPQAPNATVESSSSKEAPLPLCRTIEDIVDGGWTNDRRAWEDSEKLEQIPLISYFVRFWRPHRCKLKLFLPHEVQHALAGLTIQFFGDSTMQHMAFAFINIVWPPLNGAPYVRVHRDFDSQRSMRKNVSTRIIFKFIGARNTTSNAEGLPAFVQDPRGKALFLNGTLRNADYVVMGAGTHEVAGARTVPEVQTAIPTALGWALEGFPKVAADPRRLVWRTALPLIAPIDNVHWANGSCSRSSNAVLSWINHASGESTASFRTSLLDSHRLCLSEMFILKSIKSRSCSADGIHFETCACCKLEALILIHFLVMRQAERDS